MFKTKFFREVLWAASMKMAVLWVLAPCGPVEICRRFIGAYCIHYFQGDALTVGFGHDPCVLSYVGHILEELQVENSYPFDAYCVTICQMCDAVLPTVAAVK
jgi:hypothetical protein